MSGLRNSWHTIRQDLSLVRSQVLSWSLVYRVLSSQACSEHHDRPAGPRSFSGPGCTCWSHHSLAIGVCGEYGTTQVAAASTQQCKWLLLLARLPPGPLHARGSCNSFFRTSIENVHTSRRLPVPLVSVREGFITIAPDNQQASTAAAAGGAMISAASGAAAPLAVAA
jgi:hypothetical protein